MKEIENKKSFLELLKESHIFPGEYLFKFIVPVLQKEKIQKILEGNSNEKILFKNSKNGKYISITILKQLKTAEDVIAINKKASLIEGLIIL